MILTAGRVPGIDNGTVESVGVDLQIGRRNRRHGCDGNGGKDGKEGCVFHTGRYTQPRAFSIGLEQPDLGRRPNF